MDPQPENLPTVYAVRQLLPPPPPVVLPTLPTDIFFESFPLPVALSPLKPARARSPTRARIPTRARSRSRSPTHARSRSRTHARSRSPTRARTRGPTRAWSSRTPGPFSSLLTTPETTPEPSTAEQDLKSIKRPSNANISHVKSMFARLYPNLEADKQNEEYVRFRNRLDGLVAVHLDSSAALSHQDEESLTIVNDKLVKDFPWLARCAKTWPVAVCLQNKLHNSAAHNSQKKTRKAISTLRGFGKKS
ncbi:hypothetical protein B0H13DRAFT_1879588 [Mycena leptocephala]|nr:hypothetical protein B0H13DRAFT_1879588 [Mycena leptocephala]